MLFYLAFAIKTFEQEHSKISFCRQSKSVHTGIIHMKLFINAILPFWLLLLKYDRHSNNKETTFPIPINQYITSYSEGRYKNFK